MTSRSLCVVVAIPAPAGEEIDFVRGRYERTDGRLPAHVTLIPPFSVDDDGVRVVLAHLADVASQVAPFDLRLTGTDTFRPHSPVVFVAVVGGSADLDRLEQAVRAGAYAPMRRRPYRPHVTVAHRVGDDVLDAAFAELADFDAAVRIERLTLFEHRDRRWELVREFPLLG